MDVDRLASAITRAFGSTWAIAAALLSIVGWAVTGPLFHYSDTWQLVINTFTTLVTYVMVFFIQRAQNRDALALQVKLDELLRAVHGARNDLIAAEEQSQAELEALHQQNVAHRD